MIYVILLFACLLFSLLIMVKDRQARLMVFLIGITFVPYGFTLSDKLMGPRIMLFAFIASVLLRGSQVVQLSKMPYAGVLGIVFAAHLLTGIADQRVGLMAGVVKALVVFSQSFGGILLGYVSYSSSRQCRDKHFLRCLLKLSLLVGLYSAFCLMIHADPVSSAIGDTDSMLPGERTRVASFFYNSHVAGFAMSVYLLLLLYFRQKYKFTLSQNATIGLLFVALLLTASRSSLLDFMAGCLVLYTPYLFKRSGKLKYWCVSLLVVGALYLTIGDLVLDKFADAFKDDGGEVGGSTIGLRLQQLYFSYYLFLKNPLYGNGFNYFWEVVKVKDHYLSDMLLGAESYVFILLIERGLIQIITITLYFVCLFRFFLRRLCRESFLCMAILTAFLVNSLVTGNLNKWIFAMPFIGYYMKYVQLYIKKK